MKGFFISATNTDSGKTIVTAALLRALINNGKDAIAAKPIQTGIIVDDNGQYQLPDIVTYNFACPMAFITEQEPLFSYGFKPACSPHLAAEIENTTINLNRILDDLNVLGHKHEVLLVEGAGGLLVPLNNRETIQDLAKMTGLPVILVVDNCLGAINHALLSLQSLNNADIPLHAIVFNQTGEQTVENRFILDSNIKTILEFSGCRKFARLPYIQHFSVKNEQHWQQLETCLQNIISV